MLLIVAGGEPPGRELLAGRASRASRVIAADRGARYCLDAGLRPDLVVGDMDSLTAETLAELDRSGVACRVYSPHKDQTDTEIALGFALGDNPDRIEILGALGRRFDHALANVHLLYRSMQGGVPAFIVADTELVFLVTEEATLVNATGLTVSFLPLTASVEGVVLEGFQYPLEDASMEIGRPVGVSNVVRHARARVRLASGVLVGVMSADMGSCRAEVVTACRVGAMVGAGR